VILSASAEETYGGDIRVFNPCINNDRSSAVNNNDRVWVLVSNG
jgi:hypothetical protein